MQPLIEHLRAILGPNIGFKIGYFFLAVLAVQLLLLTWQMVRRYYFERAQQHLTRQRLQLQIKTAKARLEEAEQGKLLWNGYRKFMVARKIEECKDVFSFYLAPHDGKPLPPFKPGQYLTFQLNIPGCNKPVIRCYSLSASPRHADCYRVTIKRVTSSSPQHPPGLASNFFCDFVKPGDILDIKAPAGNFVLDLDRQAPVVLIAGGIGITPMLSMASAVADSGSKREVWLFFGARDRTEHMFKDSLERLAQDYENIRLQVCYSRPGDEDQVNRDYHFAERVSVDLLKRILPSNNYDFFICGPGPMMKSITDGLQEWGVPDQNVFFEAFGPATVKKAAPTPVLTETAAPALQINFSRSGKVCRWKPEIGSLLDFADAQGLKIEAGCRAGNCGTCLVAIKSGEVDYITEPGEPPEAGSCLTCICRPRTHLVLDA